MAVRNVKAKILPHYQILKPSLDLFQDVSLDPVEEISWVGNTWSPQASHIGEANCERWHFRINGITRLRIYEALNVNVSDFSIPVPKSYSVILIRTHPYSSVPQSYLSPTSSVPRSYLSPT